MDIDLDKALNVIGDLTDSLAAKGEEIRQLTQERNSAIEIKEAEKKILIEEVEENARLREALKNTHHHGHSVWCNSIKGSHGEYWYEEELCNCKLKQALEGK